MDVPDYIYDEALEYAWARATEEGDVDLDYDYVLIESWIDEYIEDYINGRIK